MKNKFNATLICIITIIIIVGAIWILGHVSCAEILGDKYVLISVCVLAIILLVVLAFSDRAKINILTNVVCTEEFDKTYQQLQSNYNNSLERLRMMLVIKKLIMYIAVFVFVITALSIQFKYMLDISREGYITLLMVNLISGLLFVVINLTDDKSETKYIKRYKEEVLGKYINLLEDGLKYTQVGGKMNDILARYLEPCFDERPFNKASAKDNIEGHIDKKLKVKMANIHIQKIIYSKRSNSTTELFEGIFADVTMKRNIGTILKIFAEENTHAYAMGIAKNTKLKMDSQEFEKQYNVYATNKVVAMQILTSDIMEMLLELRKTNGIMYELVIQEKHIYIRLHTGNLFKMNIFKHSMDKTNLLRCYYVLKMINRLAKKINETIEELDIGENY